MDCWYCVFFGLCYNWNMDKNEFLEIFNNQSDLLEYLKNSTNLIGAGLNLFSLGYSSETQSKVLSFLKKVNNGDGDDGEGSFSNAADLATYLDLNYSTKQELLLHLISDLKKATDEDVKNAIASLISDLENYFDAKIEALASSENGQKNISEHHLSLIYPFSLPEVPPQVAKVYNLRQFTYLKALNPAYFPTHSVNIDTSEFKHFSRQELVSLYSADKFYNLSETQIMALMQATANEYLLDNGISPCAVEFRPMPLGRNKAVFGEYSPNTGTIYINSNLLGLLDRAKSENNQYLPYQLLSTLIHEATHRIQFANFGNNTTTLKDKAVQIALKEPQSNMSYSEYLGSVDEIDARNASMKYIRESAINLSSSSLASFYNEKKKQELKNTKTDIPAELKPYFTDVYSKEMLVIKGLAKERTDYKVFKNMLANNSQEEEPGNR